MKTKLLILSLFLVNLLFSQNIIFDSAKFKIGEVLPENVELDLTFDNGSHLSKYQKLNSPLFKNVRYWTDTDNVITSIGFKIKNKSEVLEFIKRTANLTYSYEHISFKIKSEIYTNADYEYNYSKYDKELRVKSFIDYPVDIENDKFNKTTKYTSRRIATYREDKYSWVYPSIELEYYFTNLDLNNYEISCKVLYTSTEWLFADQISFLLDDDIVLKFSLIKISDDVYSRLEFVTEDHFFKIFDEDAEKIANSKNVQIRITGSEKKHYEFQMTESQKFAIKDIIKYKEEMTE